MESTRIVLKDVRLSYAHVWEPYAFDDGKAKYSTALLIKKSDTKNLNRIKGAIEAARANGKEKLANRKTIALPLRDGDEREDEVYAGCYYLNAKSEQAPHIVDRRVQPILDRAEVYSGCYCNVSVTFSAYNVSGNAGVGCYLGNIQKLRDGEPLGGGASAEEDFEDMGDEEEGIEAFLS